MTDMAANTSEADTTTMLQILLVEDEKAHAELIQRNIEEQCSECEVSVVESLREARGYLKKREPNIMILDNRLPDGEGIELLPGSFSERQFPIIMMTGQGNENVATSAFKAGASDYIVKSQENFNTIGHVIERNIREWKTIVQYRETKVALEESEEYFRSLTESATDAIIGLGPDGNVTLWNRAASKIFGYQAEEVLGKGLSDLAIPDKLIASHKKGVEHFLKTGEARLIGKPFEITAKNRYGKQFPVEMSLSKVKRENGWYITGIIRDISERKLAEDKLKKSNEQTLHSLKQTIAAVSKSVEVRDPYTAGHQNAVAEIAVKIAQKIGMDSERITGLYLGATIHDLGKIAIPAELLSKPTKLDAAEFEIIKKHPTTGFDILKDIVFPWPIALIAYQHHEKLDGSGYPQGLKGSEIILEAKIVAVADVVEAISSHRPYRPSLGLEVAFDIISKGKGVHFDPEIVEACIAVLTPNDEDCHSH